MAGEWRELVWGDLATLEYGRALRRTVFEREGAMITQQEFDAILADTTKVIEGDIFCGRMQTIHRHASFVWRFDRTLAGPSCWLGASTPPREH